MYFPIGLFFPAKKYKKQQKSRGKKKGSRREFLEKDAKDMLYLN